MQVKNSKQNVLSGYRKEERKKIFASLAPVVVNIKTLTRSG